MAGWLAALTAHFDEAAMRPFEHAAASAPHEPGQDWPALRAWCLMALSDAGAPLAVGSHTSTDGASALRRAAQVALDLDGSRLLQSRPGAAAKAALRLRVKLQDLMPTRQRRGDDIWDSGWVPPTAAAFAAVTRFTPRRPTLMVMEGLPAPAVQTMLAGLGSRSADFAHPLRVLVLSPGASAAPPWVHIPA